MKKINRNDPCWCGCGRKYKVCHEAFDAKIAKFASQGHKVPGREIIKTPEQIEGIKESCKINIAVLDYIEKTIHAGMSTAEIDKIVYDMTTQMGGIPAPLNYEGFPYSVCTSLNDFKWLFFRFITYVLHWRGESGEEETRRSYKGMCL